ncbi:MAG: 2-oxoacid:ferredoxin oxidoreductase subunit gamma [Candidatus Schekmanbacteria bacterium]|nr:MAG: 2-oxoacid:ferredoxin oxidoreductase subunit gamma [Candidatus Schekmanbacteria bacterium]
MATNNSKTEIRLSGSGGQGLILAGVILGEAAAIYENKYALQSQSYGPEARGGASKSDVIISDEKIDFPKATKIDVLLALTQKALDKYVVDLKSDGILIVDQDLVKNVPEDKCGKLIKVPIIDIARKKVGKVITANIVALGVLVGASGVVSREAIEKAVLARVPAAFKDLNKRALEEGFNAAGV